MSYRTTDQPSLFDMPRTLPPGTVPAAVDQVQPSEILTGMEAPPPPDPELVRVPHRRIWP